MLAVAENAFQALTADEIETSIEVAFTSIFRTYEEQGLNLAASFHSDYEIAEVKTYKIADEEIARLGSNTERRAFIAANVEAVLRGIFYSGTELERLYIYKIFKLFSIEFVMKGDDKIASFFKNMVSNLKLYVGTDVIIRCLSESCLKTESQSTINMLSLLNKMGATLFITEQVMDEVYTHIIAENMEYQNHYKSWFRLATIEGVSNSDRILIRAFFYSFLQPERHAVKVSDWESFLSRFGDPRWFLGNNSGEYFIAFLLKKFGLSFVPKREVDKNLKPYQVMAFKRAILSTRESELLAENDARIALYINERRVAEGETYATNQYGYRTWWLTEEFAVVQAARRLRYPANFVMHPQFLMNFCAASPAMRDLTENVSSFFPTNFGLRITDRVPEREVRNFLRQARAAFEADEAVAGAKIRSYANSLKGEQYVGR